MDGQKQMFLQMEEEIKEATFFFSINKEWYAPVIYDSGYYA